MFLPTATVRSALLITLGMGAMILMPASAEGQTIQCTVLCSPTEAEARVWADEAHAAGREAEARRDYPEAVRQYSSACDDMLARDYVPVMDACWRRAQTIFFGFGGVERSSARAWSLLDEACTVESSPGVDNVWEWWIDYILEKRERVEGTGQLEDWAKVCQIAAELNGTSGFGSPSGQVDIRLDLPNHYRAVIHGGVACSLGVTRGCASAASGALRLEWISAWTQMLGKGCNLGLASACGELSSAYRDGTRVERNPELADLYEMREVQLLCSANPENERCGERSAS